MKSTIIISIVLALFFGCGGENADSPVSYKSKATDIAQKITTKQKIDIADINDTVNESIENSLQTLDTKDQADIVTEDTLVKQDEDIIQEPNSGQEDDIAIEIDETTKEDIIIN